uniref:J domain-containing protein n=1 Tax=Angiostrongylus costaricensis TaxID=334426 RepID=A0A0R3P9E2_ANGCS
LLIEKNSELLINAQVKGNREDSVSSCRDVVIYSRPTNVSTSTISRLDYYNVLGVTPEASTKTIRAAYKARAMLWHPDKNDGSDESFRRFMELQRAYAVLSDRNKRAVYDRLGAVELRTVEDCEEGQQQCMSDISYSTKCMLLLVCVGLLTCCFSCYCCFGCCSLCRRYPRHEKVQKNEEKTEKRTELNSGCSEVSGK